MKKVNSDILKILALLTMTLDHWAFIFGKDFWIRGTIGRTAFPIFSFLLVHHLIQKQCYVKYIKRLSFFGFLTMILLMPFQSFLPFNILLFFLIIVLFFQLYSKVFIHETGIEKWILYITSFIVFSFLSFLFSYGIWGFLYILLLWNYLKKRNFQKGFFLLISSFFLNFNPINQYAGIFSLLTTLFLINTDLNYNGKRFLKRWWIFYLYFPLHLLILYLFKQI